MPLKFTKDPSVVIKQLRKLVDDAPRIAGVEAERFFKESFRKQGFEDKILQPWPARKREPRRTLGGGNNRRALLVKSGALRRSIRVVRRGKDYVIVGTSLPYAKIHNDGGVIKGRQYVKAHTRRNRNNTGTHGVIGHTRNVNTTIPRRRFMGNSAALNYSIYKQIKVRFKAI